MSQRLTTYSVDGGLKEETDEEVKARQESACSSPSVPLRIWLIHGPPGAGSRTLFDLMTNIRGMRGFDTSDAEWRAIYIKLLYEEHDVIYIGDDDDVSAYKRILRTRYGDFVDIVDVALSYLK